MKYKQRDITDCGAACFAWVCDRYRLRLPMGRLRHELGTDRCGTNVAALVQVAERLGFKARGVKGSTEALPGVPLPAIAHCLINQRLLHYVVLIEWTTKHAKVMDPAVGQVDKWPLEKFKTVWTGVLILLVPGEDFHSGDQTIAPWQRLWSLLKPHRSVLAEAFVGAMAATVLGLAMSVYVQKIVDHVIPDGNWRLLNLLGVVMLAVLLVKTVLSWCQSLISLRTAQRIDAHLITFYYRHLLRLPQSFFDSMRVGEIVSRVGDAVKIRTFLNSSFLALMLNPLILLFSLGAMFIYSLELALVSLALLPINAALYWAVNRFNRRHQRQLMESGADFDAQLVESLKVQPMVRSFRLEDEAALHTEKRLVRLLKSTWTVSLGGLGFGTVATLMASGYMIGLLWMGSRAVLEAKLTPGELMSCYTLAGYLTGPITALIGLNSAIQDTFIASDRLFDVIDLETEEDTGTIRFESRHVADSIKFVNVTFRYAGRRVTLEDVTLTIPSGRITVVSGETGCGKSTLLALLQRFYAPEIGRIVVGEHDLSYFSLASWRAGLGVVSQQTHLLSGTLLQNVAPGDYKPDLERIVRLCREVGALEFIERMPQGFATPLIEGGANLSGGQRQRLALVRAFYSDTPILLLDEPTSALDTAAEQNLLVQLARLRNAGKTIVIASHAPAVFAIADHIVRLRAGRVVKAPEIKPARDAPLSI